MVTVEEMERLVLRGADVVGPDGRRIGSLGQLFLDAGSGEPAWVTVATGLLGRGRSVVPLTGATARGDVLEVPYDRDLVKGSPGTGDDDGALSPEQELTLRRHYGLVPDEAPRVPEPVGRDDPPGTVGPDPGAADDTAGGSGPERSRTDGPRHRA